MSEEEQQILKNIEYKNNHEYCNKNDVDFLLNLIEKQQKEIKNLAKITNELIDGYEAELLEKNNYIFRLENEREALNKLIDEEMG